VLLAAAISALGGLAWNARVAARAAAFADDDGRALSLALRSTSLAPWEIDSALLAGRLSLDRAIEEPSPASRQRATERIERAVRLAPVRASARELRARLRLVAGDAPGAFADLAEAADLDPFHPGYGEARDRLRERLALAAEAPDR
jgi:hypothetical protein